MSETALDRRTYVFLMAIRRVLIEALRAIDDYLGREQTIPRRQR